MLKAGQFLQTQIQNRLSLLLGQIVFTVAYAELWLQPFRRAASSPARSSIAATLPRSRTGNQRRFRFCRGRRATDQFDNRVDVGQRNGQRFEICARSRALRSSKIVRRVTTSRRWRTNAAMMSFRFMIFG